MPRRRSCAAFPFAAASPPVPALGALLLAAWGLAAQDAPHAAPPEFVVDVWHTEQGLPQNSVNTLLQSRNGYLWLGTYNGLARFDGVRFTVFDPANTRALATSRITCLHEAPDGTLWIGHETGELTRAREGRFEALSWPPGPTGKSVVAMGLDELGALWVLKDSGHLRRAADRRELPPERPLTNSVGPHSLARDTGGFLWLAREGELARLERGALQPFAGRAEGDFISAVCASAGGGVWVAGSAGVRRWAEGRWADDLGPRPWGDAVVTCLLETRAGALLAGTLEAGLFVMRRNAPVQHINRANGLAHDWVRSLAEDHEGNLWAGTAGGLHVLRESKVRRLIAPDSWQGRGLRSVTPARAGGLWISTEGAGLYRWRDGEWQRFGREEGLSSAFVWTVAEDAAGQVWAGTWGEGLFVQRAGRFARVPGLDEPRLAVTGLWQGRDGALWAGTSAGLARHAAGRTEWFGRAPGAVVTDVRCVIEDGRGVVWFGLSGGGLGRLEGGVERRYGKGDGLSSEFVQCLHAEADGTLWIGTHGGGLNRFKEGRFAAITTAQGLPNNVLGHVADDGLGHLWLSTHGGLFRAPRAELHRCADGRTAFVSGLTYGRGDGLPGAECAAGLQPAGCRTPDGWLWFATAKGVLGVDPRAVKTNQVAPPVLVEEMVVEGLAQPVAGAAPVRLGPGRQRVGFRFTALSFVAPDKVRFRYRLEGLEADWVEAGARRAAEYSYLPPGEYTFRVTACNNDGVWNEQGATLALTVLPRYWQTWWFRAAAALAAALAVAGGMALAMRRRARTALDRLERQRAIERERARIAQDIHDDLGASLTRITLLSQSARGELDRPGQAAEDLDRIYTTARELTRAMDEIVWAVNPQHDTLDSLANYLGRFAQEFLRAAGIRCRLDVPLRLPHWPLTAEVRHNLFLAVKEALHNVVRHAHATEVNLVLALDPAGFTLTLTDNGRGFAPAAEAGPATADLLRVSGGNGIRNMRRRLEEIGGRCEVSSAPGAGAAARLVVPVRARG